MLFQGLSRFESALLVWVLTGLNKTSFKTLVCYLRYDTYKINNTVKSILTLNKQANFVSEHLIRLTSREHDGT